MGLDLTQPLNGIERFHFERDRGSFFVSLLKSALSKMIGTPGLSSLSMERMADLKQSALEAEGFMLCDTLVQT